MFLKYGFFGFNDYCVDEDLFPEAQAACASWWAAGHHYEGVTIPPTATGQTVDGSGKYVIPYCFTMDALYLYRIDALGYGKSLSLVEIVPLRRPIETAKFFGKRLIVVDLEGISLYRLKGSKIVFLDFFSLPHYIPADFSDHFKYLPWQSWNLAHHDQYLYLLSRMSLDGYGPVQTFDLSEDHLTLVDDGLNIPVESFDDPYLDGGLRIQISDFDGGVYLGFLSNTNRNYFFRVEADGSLTFLFQWQYTAEAILFNAWSQEHLYLGLPALYPCNSWVYTFTESGLIQTGIYSWDYPIEASDTQSYDGDRIGILCGTDDLPDVTYTHFPTEPVSGRFLIAGVAWDAEGIRDVFAGSAFYPYLWRADIFPQPGGSVIWQAVMDASYFQGLEGNAYSPCGEEEVTVATVADDADGDSNMSLDNPPEAGLTCLKLAATPGPMPEGEAEEHPRRGGQGVWTFSGWAVDDSGIVQGWLLSEDAGIFEEVTLGLPRPDVGEHYPQYPGSDNAGWTVSIDTADIPDGLYDVKVRILAADYQVLELGPFLLEVDHSHPRPFERE